MKKIEFSSFFYVFNKLRFVTLGVWVCVLITCAFFALDFLRLTNLNFIPPNGSPAAEANKVLKDKFPNDYKHSRFIVLMRLTGKNNKTYQSILDGNWTYRTTERIIDIAKSFKEDKSMFVNAMGRYTFEGKYNDNDMLMPQFLRTTFVSENEKSSILVLETKEKGTQKVMDWVRYMRSKLNKIDTVNGTFSLDIIGFDTLSFDMTDGASADLKFMDGISLPIALIVFIIIMRSLTVAVIPIVAVASSVLLSFAIMVPIAKAMSIPSYCPAIMMSIEIAMSIDYSLFLLSRFHEEIKHGQSPLVAAEKMLRYSGETILKSGLVFTVCLASLIAIPLKVIQAIGIGTVVGLQSTMLVALTFIPSLICSGLPFFAISGLIPCATKSASGDIKCSCNCCVDKNASKLRTQGKELEDAKAKFEKDKTKHWYRFANWVSTPLHAFLIIIGVLALLTPFCCGMLKWSVVINEDHVLPRNSPTHDAIDRFSKDWQVGELYLFNVIGTPKKNNDTVFSQEFFEVFHDLAYTIVDNASKYFNISGVLSPCDLSNAYFDYDTAESFLENEDQYAYHYIFNMQVNEKRTAAKMTLASKINPNMNASTIPLALRPILDNFTGKTNYSFYLTNDIVDMHDAVTYTFKALPYLIIAIAGIIVVMVIVAFQAPFLSLHMLFTIFLTLIWSYGCIALIFATRWFYWLTDHIKIAPGVSWVLPILTLPVLIGLALDYNIFLFTRIHEFRQRGWSPRAALIMGITNGGKVILYAGVIMAVAFSGMMFSGIMLLNQGGVVLAIGVLLDTFVISTTLNPALIYVFGFLNYWPRRFPVKHKDASEFTEDLVEGSDDKSRKIRASDGDQLTTPLNINSTDDG